MYPPQDQNLRILTTNMSHPYILPFHLKPYATLMRVYHVSSLFTRMLLVPAVESRPHVKSQGSFVYSENNCYVSSIQVKVTIVFITSSPKGRNSQALMKKRPFEEQDTIPLPSLNFHALPTIRELREACGLSYF